MTTTTSFDVKALTDAIQRRDAAAQLALYASDAEIQEVDQAGGPSAPHILHGRQEIGAHLREVCARDMTHAVTQAFAAGDHLAYEVSCTYPDGTRVLCEAIAELRDGRIGKERSVTVWDA